MTGIHGEWDWNLLSQNVPIDDVLRYPEGSWNRDELSLNPSITIDTKRMLDSLGTPNIQDDWNWEFLAQNVPIEDVRQNPGEPWNRDGLSGNRGITMEDIKYL